METTGVLFDLYGTLLEYGDMEAAWRAWFDALHGTLCDGGPAIDRDTLAHECEGVLGEPEPAATGANLTLYERRLEVLCRRVDLAADHALLRRAAAATIRAWSEYVWLDPQAKPVLDALRERVRIALVSNFDHPPHIHRVLEETGLATYFDIVVISGEVGVKKPDPAILRLALEAAGLQAPETAYVGDAIEDMQAADAAGMRGVRIDRGRDGTEAGAYYERRAAKEVAADQGATHEENAPITIAALSELPALFGFPRR